MPQITQMTQIKEKEKNKSFCGGLRGAVFSKKAPLIYKTGDLGRWLPAGPPAGGASGGVIEFLGRIDHQVKLRGYRIELEEIEKHLLQHKDIKTALVIIRENESDQTGDKSLCAYFTADTKLSQAELKNHLAQNLPGYMIPTYLVQIEKMPLTTSGKIDRKALPAPGLKAGDAYTAPRDALEKKLARIWADLLATSEEIIGIDTDFFENGGHSLSANYLALKIQKELNVKFSLMDVFTFSTLKSQAEYINEHIKKSTEKQFVAIDVLEKKSYYELSSAQRRLHILQQIEPGSIAYNIKAVFMLAGELDKQKLADTFRRIIDRHESLRTSFAPLNNKFIQQINKTVDFNISEYHAAEGECEAEPLIKAFIKPFNLSEAPLIRACTIQLEENKHILVIDMHHIITDGISMGILEREFKALYAGRELPPLRLQYKNYSEWQKKLLASEKIKKQQEYWLEICKGEIPRVDIPLDFPRPAMQSFAGNSIELQLEAEPAKNLDNFAAQTGVTHYMLFLAVLNILLAKYSGQDDIIVGTPTSGRNHADLASIIGCFVNVLVMRNFPRSDMTFIDFLQDVKQHALMAFENQDFPFDELVEFLNIKRDRSRNPVYDVVFALDEAAAPGEVLTGIRMQPYQYERGASKTDLRLGVTVQPGAITLLLTYATSLFARATAERLLAHYNEILAQVIANPNITLKNIEIYHSRVDLKSNPRRQEHDDFGF
jgi:acyl carrier protein